MNKPLKLSNFLILSDLSEVEYNSLISGYNNWFKLNGACVFYISDYYNKYGYIHLISKIKEIIEKNSIDFLIYNTVPDRFVISIDDFLEINKKVYSLMTIPDADTYFEIKDVYYGQVFDLMLCYDFISPYKFKQYGIDAISFYSSYDKNIYKYLDLDFFYDVSFVGSVLDKNNRIKYINRILNTNIKFEQFGSGTNKGFLTEQEMVEVFNKSKINLNLAGLVVNNHITPFKLKDNRIMQMKGRIAEIALCKGFILTEYIPGIENLFVIGEEIVVFKTEDEMIEKIEYYLNNDLERIRIANKGYERALKCYELNQTLPNLVNFIHNNIKSRVYNVYIDKDFSKHFGSYHFSVFFKFLLEKKFNFLKDELRLIQKNGLKFFVLGFYLKNILKLLINRNLFIYQSFKRLKKLLQWK